MTGTLSKRSNRQTDRWMDRRTEPFIEHSWSQLKKKIYITWCLGTGGRSQVVGLYNHYISYPCRYWDEDKLQSKCVGSSKRPQAINLDISCIIHHCKPCNIASNMQIYQILTSRTEVVAPIKMITLKAFPLMKTFEFFIQYNLVRCYLWTGHYQSHGLPWSPNASLGQNELNNIFVR